MLLDGSGAILGTRGLTGWGEAVPGSSVSSEAWLGYGGQFGYYRDNETGLYLCTHRYYDASAGRFLSRDPIGFDGGINLYGYTANNPTNWTDSDGLDPFGHHIVPQALWRNSNNSAIKQVFNSRRSRIDHSDYTSHNRKSYNGVKESQYRQAVKGELEQFQARRGCNLETMTRQDARDFVQQIRSIRSGPIRVYNAGVRAEVGADIRAATAARAELSSSLRGLNSAILWLGIIDILLHPDALDQMRDQAAFNMYPPHIKQQLLYPPAA